MFRALLYIAVFLLNLALFARVRSRSVRQTVLLISTYFLYCSWSFWFAAVLVTSTAMNFLMGELLRRKPARAVLAMGILLNCALLGGFKYLPEAAIHITFSPLQKFANLALPLGISFWTFQAMSYLFDLYRGDELNSSFLEFALYMAFFPVQISGPICRMPEMLPEFRSERLTAWSEISRGFARIATGVLMMQVSRLLGQGILSGDGIDRGFDRLTAWSGLDVWCLAFGYALQLFFDFAGYSHIAIGAAQALGFTVPENFARPFESTTPSIFWTRWHMSLSFWIRDYVFFPLATMRRPMWWRNFVLIVSMVLFGLWHKATILFLLWGCYHGLLLVAHRQWQRFRQQFDFDPPTILWSPLSWLCTTVLISLGWILFRANSLPQAQLMFSAALSSKSYFAHHLSGSLYLLVFILAAAYAVMLRAADEFEGLPAQAGSQQLTTRVSLFSAIHRTRWYWIPPLYILALAMVFIVTHTQDAGAAQFMYRRF